MQDEKRHRRANALANLLTNLELMADLVQDDRPAAPDLFATLRAAVGHARRAALQLSSSLLEDGQESSAPEPMDSASHVLRDGHGCHRIAEHCRSVIWLATADLSQLLYINPAFERVWGRSPSEALAHAERWHEWVHEEDRPRVLGSFAANPLSADLEFRIIRADGAVRWVHARVAPVTCCPDKVCGVIGVIDDVTERVLAARRESVALVQLEQSVREKQTLLNEVHHRVKNNLQIVSSLLYLQSRFVDDPASRAKLLESRDRVCSMGLIHELLYECDDVTLVDFERYVGRLVDGLRDAWVPDGRVLVVPRVQPIRLGLSVAVPCGLILNEALTNAFRHAFPDGRSGTVCVDLGARDGRVELAVRDDGVGFPAGCGHEAPKSLGLQLLHSLADQLGGELRIDGDDGTTVRVSFPAP